MDQDTLLKRLLRHTQTTGGAGYLAFEYLKGQALSDKDSFPDALTSWLGNLKGPLVKVGQLLAMIPDLLPPETAQKLMTLQAGAPPMGTLFVKRRLRAELGNNFLDHFGSFDFEAVAAASLGQVHKATTKDQQPLACKLQYPDMTSAVEADLSQLAILMKAYHVYDRAIDHTRMFQELRLRLLEELDYKLEAQHIALFQTIFKNDPNIHVPQVYETLSTKRLLTMSWIEGRPLSDFWEADPHVRNQLAQTIFRAWYHPFYKYHVLHGDPHYGNSKVMTGNRLGLLDFGCVRRFDPSFVQGVKDLYTALHTNDEALAVYSYEAWGFEGLTKDLIDALNMWAKYLYGPLLDDRVRPIDQSFSSLEGRRVAVAVHQKLKAAGGVMPPQEFVFVDRAALILGSLFMRLKAEVNWHRLFLQVAFDAP